MKSTRNLNPALLITMVIALAAFTGCSDTGNVVSVTDAGDFATPLPCFDDPNERGGFRTAGDWIDSEGGEVELGWFSVVIPPGAVDEDTYITVTRDNPRLATVELGPDGIQFNCEVFLKIDLTMFHDWMDNNDVDPIDLNIALFVENLGGWVALETFYAGGDFNLEDAIGHDDDDDDIVILPTDGFKGQIDDDEDIIWAVTTHFSRYALSD